MYELASTLVTNVPLQMGGILLMAIGVVLFAYGIYELLQALANGSSGSNSRSCGRTSSNRSTYGSSYSSGTSRRSYLNSTSSPSSSGRTGTSSSSNSSAPPNRNNRNHY